MTEKYIEMHCALTSKPFNLVFALKNEGRYRFARTEKVPLSLFGTEQGRVAPPSNPPDEVALSQMDWSGFFCEWCGSTDFLRCGRCGGLICDGSVEMRENKRYFECHDQCGGSGYITGVIDNLNLRASQTLLGQEKRQMLTDGRARQLSSPVKALPKR